MAGYVPSRLLALISVLACLAALPAASGGDASIISPGIIDHAMTRDAQKEPPFDPLGRTDTFLTTDSEAISWLRLGRLYSPHKVEWKWYSPDGKLCYTQSSQIQNPNKGNGECWENYTLGSAMQIKGSPAENMAGDWSVDVYLDLKKELTEKFRLVSLVMLDSGPYQAYPQVGPLPPPPSVDMPISPVVMRSFGPGSMSLYSNGVYMEARPDGRFSMSTGGNNALRSWM